MNSKHKRKTLYSSNRKSSHVQHGVSHYSSTSINDNLTIGVGMITGGDGGVLSTVRTLLIGILAIGTTTETAMTFVSELIQVLVFWSVVLKLVFLS